MINYFVPGLKTVQTAKLLAESVMFCEFVIDGEKGILLDEQNLTQAIAVLGAVNQEQRSTEYDGIMHLTLTIPVPKPPTPSADAVRQMHREQYIDACAERGQELTRDFRQSAVTRRGETEPIQGELVDYLRVERIGVRRDSGAPLCDRDAFGRLFDTLLALPKVSDVRVDPGVVCVYTDTLCAVDPNNKVKYEIGAFLIKIYLDGQAGGVRWYNLTRTVDAAFKGQQAPNVLSSGRACLGDIGEINSGLIAGLQLNVVAQLAIQFIEQLDKGDPAVRHLSRWPQCGS